MNNACPICGKVYQVGPEHVGRKILCKQCGSRLAVTVAGLVSESPATPSPFVPPTPPSAHYPQLGPPPGAAVYDYAPPPPQQMPPPPPQQMPPQHPPMDLDDRRDEPPRRRRRNNANGGIGDLLAFRLMITPILIQIQFWVGTVVCVFGGLFMILTSFRTIEGTPSRNKEDSFEARPAQKQSRGETQAKSAISWMELGCGISMIIFGPLVLRVYCESAIVFFKIHDELKEFNDRR